MIHENIGCIDYRIWRHPLVFGETRMLWEFVDSVKALIFSLRLPRIH